MKRVSATCLVHHDRDYYSVPCEYANRVVDVRSYAHKIVIAHDGVSMATHARRFDRGGYSTQLEHYEAAAQGSRSPLHVRQARFSGNFATIMDNFSCFFMHFFHYFLPFCHILDALLLSKAQCSSTDEVV